MACIKSFLDDIAANTTVMQLLGNPTGLLEDLSNTATELLDNQITYETEIYKLKDKEYDTFIVEDGRIKFKDDYGVLLTWDNGLKRGLDKVFYDEYTGGIWLSGSYVNEVQVYDKNGSLIGGWGHYVEESEFDPANMETYSKHSVCKPVSSDYVFVAINANNYYVHRLYNRVSGEVIWELGDGIRGSLSDGHVSVGYDAGILPNGNLFISQGWGSYDGSHDNGIIYEVDINTGTYIKTIAEYKGTGNPWSMEVLFPDQVSIERDPLDDSYYMFISSLRNWRDNDIGNAQIIAVFKYDDISDDWSFYKTYGVTPKLVFPPWESDFTAPLLPNKYSAIFAHAVDWSHRKVYIIYEGDTLHSAATLDLDTGNFVTFYGKKALGKNTGEAYFNWPSISKYGQVINDPLSFSKVLRQVYVNDSIYFIDSYTMSLTRIPVEIALSDNIELELKQINETKFNIKPEYISDSRFDVENKTITIDNLDLLNINVEYVTVTGVITEKKENE